MRRSPRRVVLTLVAVIGAAIAGACTEQLDAGAACPSLCPGLAVPIKDTVLSPILAYDTTLVGFPSLGSEDGIPLASRGDTLDVRGILRFDTLLQSYAPTGDSARPVTQVDTAILRLRLNLTQSRLPSWVRFEVFDVDTTADDGNSAAVLSLFTSRRLVASRTVTRAELTDSLVVPLPGAWLLRKIQDTSRVRLGVRLVASGSVSLRVHTVETGLPAELRYYVSPDTAIHQVIVSLYSKTPVEPAVLASEYRDYALVARSAFPAAGPSAFSTGGVPARRAYLRFNVPHWLLDSTTIVRATLQLTQMPQRAYDAGDSITIFGQAVAASSLIKDPFRAAQILIPSGMFVTDSIRVAPADSGVRTLELNGLMQVWKTATDTSSTAPQRAIVLLQREEGLRGAEVRFYNAKSAAAVRPRLKVSYIPRINFGVP